MGKAEEWAFQEVGQQMQGSWEQWVGKSVALCGQEVKMRVGVMEDEMGRTSGSLGCQADKRGNEHQLQARHCLLVLPIMSLPCGQKANFALFLSFLRY